MALSRKLRRRIPRHWTENSGDLFDYYAADAAPPQVSPRAKLNDERMAVTDDWPDDVPIGDAELRVIEGHLREELDALFGPSPLTCPPETQPIERRVRPNEGTDE